MNNNDFANERNDKSKKMDEKKFIQISPESIMLMGDSAGNSSVPDCVAKSLAEDASYRLRELIQNCVQILRHGKRQKLSCDDVKLAMHWSDIPLLPGQDPRSTEFDRVADAEIYVPVNKAVDLTKELTACSEVEIYSPMTVHIQFLSPETEDKGRPEIYQHYFEKITQTLLSSTKAISELALSDLSSNCRLQPVLPSLCVFLQNLSSAAKHNILVGSRLPTILNALMSNHNLNTEPQVDLLLTIMEDFIMNAGAGVSSGDACFDEASFQLVTSMSNVLHRFSAVHSVESVVQRLMAVVRDGSCNLATQCRALLGLRYCAGDKLSTMTLQHWQSIVYKYKQMLNEQQNGIYTEQVILSILSDVLRHNMRRLENQRDLRNSDWKQIWRYGGQLYALCEELSSSAVLLLGPFPLTVSSRKITTDGDPQSGQTGCNELYWMVKGATKPTPKSKWQFAVNSLQSVCTGRVPADLQQVFQIGDRSAGVIKIRVRNWRQQPAEMLRRKPAAGTPVETSSFEFFCRTALKPVSKCYLTRTVGPSLPLEIIL